MEENIVPVKKRMAAGERRNKWQRTRERKRTHQLARSRRPSVLNPCATRPLHKVNTFRCFIVCFVVVVVGCFHEMHL